MNIAFIISTIPLSRTIFQFMTESTKLSYRKKYGRRLRQNAVRRVRKMKRFTAWSISICCPGLYAVLNADSPCTGPSIARRKKTVHFTVITGTMRVSIGLVMTVTNAITPIRFIRKN